MNNIIYIGQDINNPDFVFSDDNIVSAEINASVDMLQVEMQIDTAEISVLCYEDVETLKNLPWETPIWIYSGNELRGKFYSTSVKRVGLNQYDINAVSYIGFLDNEKFYGGVYDGVPLPQVVNQIIRTDGLRTLNALTSLKINKVDAYDDMGGVQNTTWFDYDSVTNDQRNGLYVKFKFNGFNNNVTSSGTTWYAPLVGTTANPSASSTYKERQYGVMGAFVRQSTSDPYPDTTELFFCYRLQQFSIGTPNVGDIIEINCVPNEGKVTINGVDYSITAPSTKVSSTLDIFGGGLWYTSTGDRDFDHHVNLEFFDYRVTDYRNGETIIGFLPLYNMRTNKVYCRNGLYGGQVEIPCSDPETAEFADVEAPGTFPHDFRKDFVESISYSPEAQNYRVYGWIPICTKREALHQVLMPSGLSLKKDFDGNWMFSEPPNSIISVIPEEKAFDGGSIEYSGDVNEIVLKDHQYIDTSSSVISEIYTINEEPAEPFVAEFTSKPAKITTYAYYPQEGYYFNGALFIYCWSENAALIPPELTKIEGYPYNHQERIFTKKTESGSGTTVSVEDVTTITPENSTIVLQRLENYYLKSHTCRFDIVKESEKCGLKYEFINPFYEEDNGFLVSCGENLSSFSRAQCEFLCGYDPIPMENGYSNYVILTGNGTWSVPESVFESLTPKIRVVLIGGGDGGFSGCAGENGQTTLANVFPNVAKGGEAGDPGASGKILDFVILNPETEYYYSSGTGGNGANTTTSTTTHSAGAQGTESTLSDGINTYTSDDGEVLAAGHVNFLTGDKYAGSFKLPGWKELKNPESGIMYGYGGNGGFFLDNTRHAYYTHAFGFDSYLEFSYDHTLGVNWWKFGGYGDPYPPNVGFDTEFQKGSGCGGGAGIGANGTRGSSATSSKAGDGGNGGNATWIPPKAMDYNPLYYGYGGHGGGGGGAGGASGYFSSGSGGTGGTGGYGGVGGVGGDGCILIYY